jgi:hypothetical protein
VALADLGCAVIGVFAMVQLRFGNDVTGIYIALGLALPVLRLVNACLDDMSLVGPQPALADEAAKYADHVRRRFAAKPGLTGLWPATGRSELSQEESVPLDLGYVENRSFALRPAFRRTICSALVHRSDAC